MKTNLLIYLAAFILLSCNEDIIDKINDQPNQPTFRPLITIKSTENLDKDFQETWLIVSDESGQILASGELTKDSTFTTDQSVGNSVNITFLKASEDRYQLDTYTDVKINDTWVIPNRSMIKFDGEVLRDTINIENAFLDSRNNSFLFSVSNAHGNVSTGGSITGNSIKDIALYIIINQQAPKDILVVFHDGVTAPTYRWFDENLFAEDNVDLDFQSEFTPMDHSLVYSFNDVKSIYMDITAYDEENLSSYKGLGGYIQAEFLHSEAESSYQYNVGYLDGFDFYRTRFSANISGRAYAYEKFGSSPQVFGEDLFDSDFEITDSAYNAFQFTTTGDFDVASGIWISEDEKIRWAIHYPIVNTGNQILADFPTDIKTKYPDLILSNLKFDGARFIDMIENEGYSNFIVNLHKDEDGKNIFEQYSLYKSAN